MPDTAGNSLATATPLKLLSTAQSYSDLVTPAANDFYRFSLANRSSFNLSLTGLDADANVALLDSAGRLVNINGVGQLSNNQGRFSESINTTLNPGVYYIQVAPGINTPTANYTLNVAANTPPAEIDLIWSNRQTGAIRLWDIDSNGALLSNQPASGRLSINTLPWTIRATGDFNGDGQADLLWRSGGLTRLWLLKNNTLSSGNDNFLLPSTKSSAWQLVGTGDFNNDTQTDILWWNPTTAKLEAWLMQGVRSIGTLAIPQQQQFGWTPRGVGDFNRDGSLDILWQNNSTAAAEVWFLNQTTFLSEASLSTSLPRPWQIAGVSDFNNDGNADILWRFYGAGGNNQIWFMNGTTLASSVGVRPVNDVNWVPLPYSTYREPTPIDVAGNTPASAFNLGTGLGQLATYRDRVGGLDSNDYYRFDITNTAQVSLGLTNLTGNVDLQLFDSSGNTILGSSAQSGLSPESIIRSLSAGTYYVRVFPALGQTDSSYTLSVNISSAPVLVSNNPLTLNEEGSAIILSSLLQVTDSDTPNSQLVYTVGNSTTNGSLVINGITATAGSTFTQVNLDDPSQVSYVHNGSETTSDRFSFTVSDGTGGSISNQTFSIQVNPVNDAPILVSNRGLTLSEGDGTVLSPDLLLISDVDSPAVSLQYSITNLPTNGTLLLAGTATSTFTQSDVFNGLVRYQHNGSELPFDRFTFTVTDGAILLPGANTFSISVLPVNDAPAVSINTALTLSEGASAAITPNLLFVTDPDGPAPVAYTLGSTPANGILKLGTATLQTGQTFTQLNLTNGQLTYIHNGSETTSDRFQFTVTDGLGATSVATTFSISVLAVNDAPVLTAPGTLLVDQNTNTLISGVRLTDADVGDNDVTVSLSAGSGVLSLGRTTGVTFLTGDGTQDSTLSFRGRQDVANFVLESLTYRSTGAFEGTDIVNITVNDGGNFGLGGVKTDSKNVTLTVAGVNDAPMITAPALQTLSEDVASPINGISIVDSDAGLNPLTVSLSVVYGALTLGSTAGLTLTTGTGTLNKNLVFSGSQGAINTALAGLTYLSDRNYNGSDLLTLNVSDNGFTGNGIPLSASKLINLTINPTNDAPVITVPSSQSVNEGTDLRISGININDVDVSNGSLTVAVSAVSGLLSLESLTGLTFTTGDGTQDNTLIFQGTQSAVNTALSSLTYRPNANFGGTDTIAVSVSDGGNTGTGIPLSDSKSIAVNVLGINNAPVIALPTGTPAVDSGINLTLSGFSVNDPDASGGTLSVTLFAENGVLSLRSLAGLQITQGTGTQNNRITFTGSIAAINDALSQVTYRSYAGFTNAFDRITLSVNDNGNTGIGIPLSDTKTLLVNVGNAVNLLPIATADSFTVAERGTLLGTSVLANDSDPDFTLPLTAQLVSPPTNAGTFTFNPNGTFTYTPAANFNGSDTFSYVATDILGGTSNTAIVVINVTSVNDLPVAANDSFTTLEDQPASGNVLTNDTDVDHPTSSLSAQLINAPANSLSFNFNPDGSFTYTPQPNFNGIDRFTYVVIDPLSGVSNTAIVSLTITPVNDAPIAANDGVYTASAGGTLTVSSTNGVLRNDSDVESSALTATLVTAPTNGTVSLSGDGSFIYRPTGNFAGTDVFTYRASDGGLASNLATVTLSVGSNNAPIAQPDTFTLTEDTLLNIGNVLTNDTDSDGNIPLTASVITTPTNALSFTLRPDGTFSYQPTPNFSGLDTFTYAAIDSLGAVSSVAIATFSVTPVNDAPVAVNDIYSVNTTASLSQTAPGVLANDTDLDSANLTAVLVSGVQNGTLNLNANGSFTYQPNTGFSGSDRFIYVANDGSLNSTTATVNLFVTASVNAAPIANPDTFTVAEDTLLNTGNVLTNDTDSDGNIPLTASVITTPTNALSFTLRPDGTFSYQPTPNFSGLDTFTYAAIDSLGAVSSVAIATFSVTPVNDAPVAVNDIYNVAPSSSLNITALGVLSNDIDIEGNPLTASLVTAPSSGTFTLNPDGSFTYLPQAGFSGNVSFTYVASDGISVSNTAIATISVSSNAPPIAAPDLFIGAANTLLTIGNVLANDTDSDGNIPLTASVITTPTNALSFTLRPDGTFSYQPTPNFSGLDTFTYAAIDSLGAVSSVAIATFSVTGGNNAPVAQNDTYTVNAGSPLTITPVGGILSNDTDLEGNTLTASVVANPLSGSLTLNSNGSFNYTPNSGFFGSDRFTYLATDGQLNSNTATVSIQVNAIPVAASDTYTAVIGAALTVAAIDGVLQNDIDADGSPLTASVVVNPSKGTLNLNANGSFIYTSAAGSSGIDTFVYQATDGFATSTPTTVTLSLQTNTAPIATDDLYRASTNGTLSVDAFTGVLNNDIDAETSALALTATVATGAQNGTVTLNSNGSFVYRPNSGYQGLDRFTYRASDGLATSGLATVSLSVSPNTPPAAQNDSYQAVSGIQLNQSSILESVLANDSDAEDDPLTASVVSTPGNGTLTLNPNGTFIYTSTTGYQGTDIFTYRAFDGIASSTATVSISVRLNTPPTALPDTYTAIAGQTLNVTAPGLLINDTDAEDPISAQPLSQPTRGSLDRFNADGSFVYTPDADFTTGTDFFTYQATDGFLNSAPVTVTINVSPLTAVNDTYSVNRGNVISVPKTLGVLANDLAPNATVAVVNNPTQGVLNLNSDGSFAYTPNSGATDTDTFTYRATSGGTSSTAIVTININATSTPPTAQNDGYVVSTNGTLNVTAATGVLANDADVDGDVIRTTLATAPTNGSVVLNADGSFRYIPTAGSVGSDTFTYRATDGINLSAPATVVITVGGANAAPVITLPGSQLAVRNTDLLIPSGLSIRDVDAGSNLVTTTLTAINGTVTLGGLAGLTFTIGDGTADTTMTFTGAIAAINTALTNLKFTPTNNFTGAAQIGLVVNDGGFTGTGGAQTGSGTVSINVSSGAALVANISPLATSSSPTNLTAVGDLLYFAADDSTTGNELWKSDGSASATLLVANINPAGAASSPSNLTVVGNTVYFTAINSDTGRELWKTDLAGTSATLVSDLRLETLSSNPMSLVNFDNTLFFQANDGSGSAIFKIDGSGNPVKVVASPSYSFPGNLTVVGNTLYFTANSATQLWKTDGTNGNTVLVRDLGSSPSAQIQRLTAVGDTVFFTAIDSSGRELWRSDGTGVNTARVADLNPGSASSTPDNLVNVNGTLYFFARDAATVKLWRSNAGGTVTLVSTLPSASQSPNNLVAIGSKLFFTVDVGSVGSPDLQLWSSDGISTAAVVKNINAAGNDTVASLTNFNGSLYFTANDGTGTKVFRTDGTSAGTVAVSSNFSSTPTGLTVVDGKLFFAATDATNGTELWAVQ
jgi:ELWxxDGT repeat protein/VCBS repeat-containing protein